MMYAQGEGDEGDLFPGAVDRDRTDPRPRFVELMQRSDKDPDCNCKGSASKGDGPATLAAHLALGGIAGVVLYRAWRG